MRRDLALLDPDFRPHAERLIARFELVGFPFHVFETYRSNQRQAQLYAKGRSTPGPKVTRVIPGHSAHNHGMAIDLVPKVEGRWTWDNGLSKDRMKVERPGVWEMWREVAAIWRADFFEELAWGGQFGYRPPQLLGWDPWHFELRGWRRRIR